MATPEKMPLLVRAALLILLASSASPANKQTERASVQIAQQKASGSSVWAELWGQAHGTSPRLPQLAADHADSLFPAKRRSPRVRVRGGHVSAWCLSMLKFNHSTLSERRQREGVKRRFVMCMQKRSVMCGETGKRSRR